MTDNEHPTIPQMLRDIAWHYLNVPAVWVQRRVFAWRARRMLKGLGLKNARVTYMTESELEERYR